MSLALCCTFSHRCYQYGAVTCLTRLVLKRYGGSDISLRLAGRFLYFIEHVTESEDPERVLVSVDGDLLICPGEN